MQKSTSFFLQMICFMALLLWMAFALVGGKPADEATANVSADRYLASDESAHDCMRKGTYTSNRIVLVLVECVDGRLLEYAFLMDGDIVDKAIVSRSTSRSELFTSIELDRLLGFRSDAETVIRMRDRDLAGGG
jgi:hypothetical protein